MSNDTHSLVPSFQPFIPVSWRDAARPSPAVRALPGPYRTHVCSQRSGRSLRNVRKRRGLPSNRSESADRRQVMNPGSDKSIGHRGPVTGRVEVTWPLVSQSVRGGGRKERRGPVRRDNSNSCSRTTNVYGILNERLRWPTYTRGQPINQPLEIMLNVFSSTNKQGDAHEGVDNALQNNAKFATALLFGDCRVEIS